MKITREQLNKIVQEELYQATQDGELSEEQLQELLPGLKALGKAAVGSIKKGAAKVRDIYRSGEAQAAATKAGQATPVKKNTSKIRFAPPVEDETGTPVTPAAAQPAAAQPAAAEPAPAVAQPAAAQPAAAATQPAAENPKLMKRMEIFKQNMPQYFQSIQKKITDIIKSSVSANLQQIKEAADPASTISSLISKELNNALSGALKNVTPEEFLKAYQVVAKKNIKDPKQLAQSLKSFRGLEEQETVDVNPLAGSEMDLFDAVLQAKRIGISSLVKQAAEKALANPQVQRFLPPEQASKVVATLTNSARTVRQLLSINPQLTAQKIAKSTASTSPAPAAASTPATTPAPPKQPNRDARRAAKSKAGGPTQNVTATGPAQNKGRTNANKKMREESEENNSVKESDSKIFENWKKLAGIIKG